MQRLIGFLLDRWPMRPSGQHLVVPRRLRSWPPRMLATGSQARLVDATFLRYLCSGVFSERTTLEIEVASMKAAAERARPLPLVATYSKRRRSASVTQTASPSVVRPADRPGRGRRTSRESIIAPTVVVVEHGVHHCGGARAALPALGQWPPPSNFVHDRLDQGCWMGWRLGTLKVALLLAVDSTGSLPMLNSAAFPWRQFGTPGFQSSRDCDAKCHVAAPIAPPGVVSFDVRRRLPPHAHWRCLPLYRARRQAARG